MTDKLLENRDISQCKKGQWILSNVEICFPFHDGPQKGHILCSDGIVQAVYSDLDALDLSGARQLSCKGKLILPSLWDMLAVLGEPHMSTRESFASLRKAALAGGFGNVAVRASEEFEIAYIEQVASIAKSGFHPVANLTRNSGKELVDMGRLKQAGAVAFYQDPNISTAMLFRALQYGASFGLPVIIRLGDVDLERLGEMNEGEVSQRIGLRGIPSCSEEISLSRAIALAQQTHAKVHVSHLSTARGVELIANAKYRGVNISCSVAARSLILSDSDIERSLYDPNLRLLPPLGSEDDRDALIGGVKSGIIDGIFSDHQPLTIEEKEGCFSEVNTGSIGLETAFSAALTALQDPMLVVERFLFWSKLLDKTTNGLIGSSISDMLILDQFERWIPTPPFFSKGSNEPLSRKSLQGDLSWFFPEE